MTERVFLGWDRPFLPAAVAHLIERYAREGVLDLRRVSLVLPGARPGRRVKELLLDGAATRGLRLAPPRVLSVGGLPELFYQPKLPLARSAVITQAWASVLRTERTETLAELFGSVPGGESILGWSRLAARVAALQREVGGAGFRFDDVAAECTRATELLFDDSRRWSLLGRIQTAYEVLLTRLGCSDPDLGRIDALASGALASDSEVWLIGVAELPRISARIVGQASSPSAALIQAPAEEAEQFDDLGRVRPERWQERQLPVMPSHVRVADRPADQAGLVVRELAGIQAASIAEVVVGVADAELTPYLQEWLAVAGLPVHSAAGTRLDRSPPYRLLEATAAFLETGEWEEFAALVRHPDLEAWLAGGLERPDASASYLDRLDRYFAEHLPAGIVTVAGPTPVPAALEPLRRLGGPEMLGRLGGERPLHRWAEPILDFLGEVYGARRLSGHDPADQAILEVLGKLKEAAHELQRLPEPLSHPCAAAPAIRILLEMAGGQTIAEDAEKPSIEVLGWLELPLDDAPCVLVAGVNEGKLPRSESADSFLPDGLRHRLELLDNATRYARDAFHLEALVHSRAEIRLIAGRVTADGDPLRPSRLLLTQRGEELATRVVSFVRSSEGGGALIPFGAETAARSSFALPPEPTLSFTPPVALSVTAFRRILEDPFRFALEAEIGRGEGDDEARELDGPSFGNLAHRVLRRFGHSPDVRSADPAVVRRRLDQLLADEARRTFGNSTYAAVHLQIEHLRLRLGRFAEWQARRVAEGWVVRHVEGEEAGLAPAATREDAPGAEGRAVRHVEGEEAGLEPTVTREGRAAAEFDVDGKPIVLTGRIDRIDQHPASGRWAILDYKTGDRPETPEETHRRKRSGEWKDLQLPLYRHLAAGLRTAAGEPLLPAGANPELGYVLLSRDLDRIGEELADWSEEDLRHADETARAVIRHLREGVAVFDPGRVRARTDDPLAPLLGLRQLVATEADAETPGEDDG